LIQSAQNWLSKTHPFLLVILIALFSLSVRVVIGPHFIDDAYITFRYARNLAQGAGFVYNEGERVLGTSTPLLTVLLALADRLGLGILAAAFGIGVLCDTVAVFVLWCLGRFLSANRVGLGAASVYAVSPFSVIAAVSGMETSLYTLSLLLTFSLFIGTKRSWWVIPAAMATLIRPEGGLVLIAAFVASALNNRRMPWCELAIGIALVFPWFLFATLYFGSPIPNTVVAKTIVYPSNAFPLQNLFDILRQLSNLVNGAQVSLLWSGIYFSASAVGIEEAIHRNKAMMVLLGWMLLDIAFFAVPNRFLFPWYMVPAMPLFLFFACLGIEKSSRVLLNRLTLGTTRMMFQLMSYLTIAIIWTLMFFATFATVRAYDDEFAHREFVYACLGQQLDAHSPGLTISSAEIGALGYHYPGKILDLAGLISPIVLPYYSSPDYQFRSSFSVPSELIRVTLPPVIVVFDSMIPFLNEAWFRSEYYLHTNYPRLHHFGSLLVFVRRDVSLGNAPINCLDH